MPETSLLNEAPSMEEKTALASVASEPAIETTPETSAPEGLAALLFSEFGAVKARLDAAEATIAQLVSHAQAPMQLMLGATEITAIGDALHGRFEQAVHDVLKAHYGFTPPAKR